MTPMLQVSPLSPDRVWAICESGTLMKWGSSRQTVYTINAVQCSGGMKMLNGGLAQLPFSSALISKRNQHDFATISGLHTIGTAYRIQSRNRGEVVLVPFRDERGRKRQL